jgi:hypothetical protein
MTKAEPSPNSLPENKPASEAPSGAIPDVAKEPEPVRETPPQARHHDRSPKVVTDPPPV